RNTGKAERVLAGSMAGSVSREERSWIASLGSCFGSVAMAVAADVLTGIRWFSRATGEASPLAGVSGAISLADSPSLWLVGSSSGAAGDKLEVGGKGGPPAAGQRGGSSSVVGGGTGSWVHGASATATVAGSG